MRRITSILIICFLAAFAAAGKRPEPVRLFNQKDIGAPTVKSYVQGTAISGDFLFSLRAGGLCVVIDLSRNELVSKFPLASAGKTNHANDAFFSGCYYDPEDRFPLLYVTQCSNSPLAEIGRPECDSLSRLLFVERVICDAGGRPTGSELVQVISYQPAQWNSRLYVFDSSTPDRLYCYGNTIGNRKKGNRIVVETLRMPAFDRNTFLVTLDSTACIDRIYVDEALPKGHRGPQNNIIQGGCAGKGLLYLPVGGTKPGRPSELFVIDLKKRDKSGKPFRYFYADYNDVIPGEMEDVDIWKGKFLVCTTNSTDRACPVYSFPIKNFKLVKREAAGGR